ncbi:MULTISPECIES: hypothetical protein [Bacillales]|nr:MULTISPECIES: hypothetical protein [Bacillaceae]MBF0709166.1 hypothetical protein [Pseudalkalibacillus hwajinpoensis]MDO6655222.1 hypothetical protein [Anaerobacillus sp. 1_MG-2023]WLR60422.1 hypothetical protein LC071_03375 [Pseudalkalibacillus hwajinpoensis]
MNGKPIHFDGSSVPSVTSAKNQPLKITDDVRKCISCNPFQLPPTK